jgi:hypothetical protein
LWNKIAHYDPLPPEVDYIPYSQAASIFNVSVQTLQLDRKTFKALGLIAEGRASGFTREEFEVIRIFRNYMRGGRYNRFNALKHTVTYFEEREESEQQQR